MMRRYREGGERAWMDKAIVSLLADRYPGAVDLAAELGVTHGEALESVRRWRQRGMTITLIKGVGYQVGCPIPEKKRRAAAKRP
jgi:biotin operon repressor